jgi:chromosome segregation ATPase
VTNYLEMAVLCTKCISNIEKTSQAKTAQSSKKEIKTLKETGKKKEAKELETKTKRKLSKKVNKESNKMLHKAKSIIYVVDSVQGVKKKATKATKKITRSKKKIDSVDLKVQKIQSKLDGLKDKEIKYLEDIKELEAKKLDTLTRTTELEKDPILYINRSLSGVQENSKQKITHYGLDGNETHLVKVGNKWFQWGLTLKGEEVVLNERAGKIKEKKIAKRLMKKVVE